MPHRPVMDEPVPTLAEIGITKDESADAQILTTLPTKMQEQVICDDGVFISVRDKRSCVA